MIPEFAPGVRDAIYRHVYEDPANELGGILVGDRRAVGTMIVGAIPAIGARGDVTSLTFTPESWSSMLGELESRYPGAEIIGWYHSHPGHGVFLSSHDRFIHQHFFSAPWQVAVVVDPQQHYEGLFMWSAPTDGTLDLVAEALVDPRWSADDGAVATAGAAATGASAAPPTSPRAAPPRSASRTEAQPAAAPAPVPSIPEPPRRPTAAPPAGLDDDLDFDARLAAWSDRADERAVRRAERLARDRAIRRRDRAIAIGLLVAGVAAVAARLL